MSKVEFCALEPRLLLSANVEDDPALDRYPAIFDSNILPAAVLQLNANTASASVTGPAAASSALNSIPQLHSLPGAKQEIYLDFLGASSMNWGGQTIPASPAYSTDSNTSSFSPTEIANIQQIWSRVAEKYSPFNIDVTTVDPGTYTPGIVVRAVIGGDGSWTSPAGGISYVGGFVMSNSAANTNTVFVFPDNLGSGNPKYTAEATAHEVGHSFGLNHQSVYSGTTKTAEYNSGNADVAPIMGDSYYATRGLWWSGPSDVSSTSRQDDMSIIASSTNGFGYRPDDFGSSLSTASALSPNGDAVSISGVIERTTDTDWFHFATQSGPVSFTVSPAQYGGMLNATLKIVDATGKVLASADTASLGETLSLNLASGTYDVVVGSHGSYGDVGQYTLTGTIQNNPNYVVLPPSAVTGVKLVSAAKDSVTLGWANATNATSYSIEQYDATTGWTLVANVDGNTTSYTIAGLSEATSYQFRIRSSNIAGDSDWITINASTVFAAPTALTQKLTSSTTDHLSWTDNTGIETGYVVQRSTNGGTTWTDLAQLAAGSTSYDDATLARGGTYLYRVLAVKGTTRSASSNVVAVTIAPATPTSIQLISVKTTSVTFSWTDVAGETQYRIERSIDGGITWNVIGTTPANVVSATNTGLLPGTRYLYRVRAINGGGISDPTSVLDVLTLINSGTNKSNLAYHLLFSAMRV